MDVLPLKEIREEDAPLVGQNLVYLARLLHLGLPVANGIVVTPPEITLNTVLKKYDLKDREVFEQSLTLIRREILETPIPEELQEAFKQKKVNVKNLWVELLDSWIQEIRGRVWREGFSPDL